MRIGSTLARAQLRPRVGPYEQARLRLRVWPGEADLRNVHQAVYPLYMELGRWDFSVRLRMTAWLWQQRCAGIVGAQLIRYERPLVRFQSFELSTRVATWDDKWLYIEALFESSTRRHALGCARILFMDSTKRKIPPAEVLLACGGDGRPAPPSNWTRAFSDLSLDSASSPPSVDSAVQIGDDPSGG